jgi:hypothetical protein
MLSKLSLGIALFFVALIGYMSSTSPQTKPKRGYVEGQSVPASSPSSAIPLNPLGK